MDRKPDQSERVYRGVVEKCREVGMSRESAEKRAERQAEKHYRQIQREREK